jgi:hypothetical protein
MVSRSPFGNSHDAVPPQYRRFVERGFTEAELRSAMTERGCDPKSPMARSSQCVPFVATHLAPPSTTNDVGLPPSNSRDTAISQVKTCCQ